MPMVGFENVWSSSSKASSAFSGAIPAPIGTDPMRWPVFDYRWIEMDKNANNSLDYKQKKLTIAIIYI